VSAPSVLTATTRTETGKKVSGLRKAGRIPAVVFGHGLASIPVSLDAHEFEHFRRTAHSNLIVELKVDEGVDLGDVVATGSSLATAAVLDAFCEIARVSRGYDWRRLLFTHPSGAVGRNAQQAIERLTRLESDE